ncbi:MAG TPA: hypothetical protein VM243_09235 [Phycisphaerae bacterium]|nr:hypothetical protein [Phycisphaerae bacterium]
MKRLLILLTVGVVTGCATQTGGGGGGSDGPVAGEGEGEPLAGELNGACLVGNTCTGNLACNADTNVCEAGGAEGEGEGEVECESEGGLEIDPIPYPNSIQLDETDHGCTVYLQESDDDMAVSLSWTCVFDVDCDYEWGLAEYDWEILKDEGVVGGGVYDCYSQQPDCGGDETTSFSTRRAGCTIVRFEYRQWNEDGTPASSDPPAEEFEINVVATTAECRGVSCP